LPLTFFPPIIGSARNLPGYKSNRNCDWNHFFTLPLPLIPFFDVYIIHKIFLNVNSKIKKLIGGNHVSKTIDGLMFSSKSLSFSFPGSLFTAEIFHTKENIPGPSPGLETVRF
jgi:hypothetical protein